MPVCGSGIWFFSYIFAQFAEAGKKSQQRCAPAREECNKCDLTGFPVFDWPIIMIRPGGLLLRVLTYLQSCFSFMGGIAKT
jgi:hypothetical protein